jgi:hypothetical protein
MQRAIAGIESELEEQLAKLENQRKLLEAQWLRMRTQYDIEMMRQVGFYSGIENYSRHIDGHPAGSAPATLLDYFPEDFLLVIDESHVTVSQIGGMYEGDASRKRTLVEHGFRLPSALDNRLLTWEEFQDRPDGVSVGHARGARLPLGFRRPGRLTHRHAIRDNSDVGGRYSAKYPMLSRRAVRGLLTLNKPPHGSQPATECRAQTPPRV